MIVIIFTTKNPSFYIIFSHLYPILKICYQVSYSYKVVICMAVLVLCICIIFFDLGNTAMTSPSCPSDPAAL